MRYDVFEIFVWPPVNALQVKVQYEADYRRALDGELQPHLPKRGYAAIRLPEDNLRDFETSNLIVLFSKF